MIVSSALDRTWLDQAACLGMSPHLFFRPGGGDHTEAKEVCRDCPVAEECLHYAIAAGETHGVWGGMTPRERSRWAARQGLTRHGTLTGYTADGCRCGRCRQAVAEYTAARRGGGQ